MVDFKLENYWTVYNESVTLDDSIKNSDLPLVIYFTAKWCGPCKLMGPALEEKLEVNKNFRVVKVETDKYEDLAMDYEIPAIPTFYLYHKGAKVDQFIGTKDDLIDNLYKKIASLQN